MRLIINLVIIILLEFISQVPYKTSIDCLLILDISYASNSISIQVIFTLGIIKCRFKFVLQIYFRIRLSIEMLDLLFCCFGLSITKLDKIWIPILSTEIFHSYINLSTNHQKKFKSMQYHVLCTMSDILFIKCSI